MSGRTEIIGADGRVIGWIDGEPAQLPATNPRMTHFGFLSRLTPQERTAVRASTANDPVLDDAMFLFN